VLVLALVLVRVLLVLRLLLRLVLLRLVLLRLVLLLVLLHDDAPRLAAPGVDVGVRAEERLEGADLVPPCEQLLRRVAEETTHVGTGEREAGQTLTNENTAAAAAAAVAAAAAAATAARDGGGGRRQGCAMK
jgi:hypothetical protein